MCNSLDIMQRRCEMFDSYCKTVLRNYARDLDRAAHRRENCELLTDDPMRYLHFFAKPIKEVELSEQFTIMCLEIPCTIQDERLYDALLSLADKLRTVILCDSWLNMTDVQIAALYGVTERTIYNWRQRACQQIKLFFENGGRK